MSDETKDAGVWPAREKRTPEEIAAAEEAQRRAFAFAERVSDRLRASPTGRLSEEVLRGLAVQDGEDPERVVKWAIDRGAMELTQAQLEMQQSARRMKAASALIGLNRGIDSARQLGAMDVLAPFFVLAARPIETEAVSPGGIVLAEKAPEKPSMGIVVAVGRGYYSALYDAGIPEDQHPKPGEVIIYSRHGGQEMVLPQGKVVFLAPKEVWAIYRGNIV